MKANEIIKESRNELVDRIIENLENGYIFTKSNGMSQHFIHLIH